METNIVDLLNAQERAFLLNDLETYTVITAQIDSLELPCAL
jgi:hypothetical protein